MKILVTGSSRLIGSEVCSYFSNHGHSIHGIDNNQRAVFFGKKGDTTWRLKELRANFTSLNHYYIDIKDRSQVLSLLQEIKPDAIVHAAAQPSHDKAASIPFEDFDVNSVGTLNLLEATRQTCTDAIFVHMSTNKVYGDGPNTIKLTELEKKWDYADPKYQNGIPENFPFDQCMHSLFGSSKASADLMFQEYGRYFGMSTCCLRGGCLTGPSHSGVEMHGFLSYLVKYDLSEQTYKIFGYQGKQVRDNNHSEDVARLIECFLQAPRSAEVYNLGGGKENSSSILEAFEICEQYSNKRQKSQYFEENRLGDHICYYSDLRKIYSHFPNFKLKITLKETIRQIVVACKSKKY